ncbi:hypothetical protein PILCRDRAFT_201968 [Piloderma croceum F 1598]|uniref:Uncharacterized protein n=1 Tax=Piloderma croceum (strain F 1598) TaxID=765440 RepID=A0A0C3G124_PILCF|nr:hypothetical protein PILCRDRAFT_201968 [Piloderma croceum F 1598]
MQVPSKPNAPSLVPEIWQEIFPYLPSHDIFNSTLTCRYFRLLAQPLYFRNIVFRPYVINRNNTATGRRCRPSEEACIRLVRRLKFCTSEAIAAGVRHLIIRPVESNLEVLKHAGDDMKDSMLYAVLDHLPKFVASESITFINLWWTPPLWREFRPVPRLKELLIIDCSLEAGESDDTICRLQIPHLLISSSCRTFATENWLSVVTATHIAFDITLIGPSEPEDLHLQPITMRHLQSLATSVTPDTLSSLAEVLGQKPPLEKLGVVLLRSDVQVNYSDILNSFPRTALPLLDTFHGPYELFRRLSTDGSWHNLRDLVFDGTVCEAAMLTGILRELGKATTALESLEYLSIDSTEQLYLATLSTFHHLKYLRMGFVRTLADGPAPVDAYNQGEFLLALSAMTFPSGIKKLAIAYQRENGNWAPTQRTWHSTKGILEQKNPTLLKYAITARGRHEVVWRRDDGSAPFTCAPHLAATCAHCEEYLFGKHPPLFPII